MDIKEILQADRVEQNFWSEFIGMVQSFKSHIECYEFGSKKNSTPIRNTDLWIEAYIEILPDLKEFRSFVHQEMKRLEIEPYQADIYSPENNHYIYSNSQQIEALKNKIQSITA